jgi:malic enzyme
MMPAMHPTPRSHLRTQAVEHSITLLVNNAGVGSTAPLLPPLEDIRGVSRRVALAVAAEAQRQGVAERAPAEASERLVDAKMWTPRSSRLRRRAG